MIKPIFTYSILLMILGVGAYYGTDRVSFTALIPAFFGLAILICGLFALSPRFVKHAMHTAVLLSLFGFGGTISGVFKVFFMLKGSSIERPEAAIAQSIMALLCLTFVVLSVRWFLRNRRKKAPRMIGS